MKYFEPRHEMQLLLLIIPLKHFIEAFVQIAIKWFKYRDQWFLVLELPFNPIGSQARKISLINISMLKFP